MTRYDSLLSEIETFLAATGVGETYFGKLAANNPWLVKRLREGSRVWPETEDRIRAFMSNHRPSKGEVAE